VRNPPPPIGNITFGMWKGMIERCHDPRHSDYRYYGARGIAVCDAWRSSFQIFAEELVAAIGPRPENYQTDRIDNARGYEPGNIRWVTSKENNNNRRSSKFITHNGETLTAAQWADRTGIPRQQIANRINRGWSVEDALTKPLEPVRTIEIDGEVLPIAEWAKRSKRPKSTINNRLSIGMTAKEAVFGELCRRFDGMCPRCGERPRTETDHYCTPCRKDYNAKYSRGAERCMLIRLAPKES
jgi:hypothetical protein